MNRTNVFIVCTGVGHINRGYETFTIECFNALKNTKAFELYMLKGGGKASGKEIKISCLKRNSSLVKLLGKVFYKESYWIEQFTFLFGMLPALIRYQPSLIYYSDFILGTFLWHLRRIFNLKYKLLFSNGAPNLPPFTRMDHVQQLLPTYLKKANEAGAPEKMQTLLPYGFNIIKNFSFLDKDNRDLLKIQLRLPVTKKIILSVGAVNARQKRMDYVIEEFAILNPDEYFLLILGQIDEESKTILKKAETILQKDSYSIFTADSKDMHKFFSVTDYFILASLSEGFGRVLIEAMQFGLMPIVHDYDVTKEVLEKNGMFVDLTKPRAMFEAIKKIDKLNISKADLIDFAFEKYSWDTLSKKYEGMILSIIN